MTVSENIKKLARQEKDLSITSLEQELGYSNGSLSKAKDIPSSRIYEISKFLNVSMEYIMTGEKPKIPLLKFNDDSVYEMIEIYEKLNKEQKSAVLNLLRSFAQ